MYSKGACEGGLWEEWVITWARLVVLVNTILLTVLESGERWDINGVSLSRLVVDC